MYQMKGYFWFLLFFQLFVLLGLCLEIIDYKEVCFVNLNCI